MTPPLLKEHDGSEAKVEGAYSDEADHVFWRKPTTCSGHVDHPGRRWWLGDTEEGSLGLVGAGRISFRGVVDTAHGAPLQGDPVRVMK